jgi:hypothetical protein
LGFLAGSCCPHYDGEAERRPALHRLIAGGQMAAGIAIEDWTGVHYRGTERCRIVSAKLGSRAYAVAVAHGSVQETPLAVDYLV